MKKTILLTLSSITIIVFICMACVIEEEIDKKLLVTYSFTTDDQRYLLSHYTEGKVFSFGEDDKKFKVVGVERQIRQYAESGGKSGGAKYYFYYEEKRIILEDYSEGKRYTLMIRKYPIDFAKAINNPDIICPSQLSLLISGDSHYDAYGRCRVGFIYGDSTTTLTVNDLVFTKVRILDRICVYDYQNGVLDKGCVGSMFNEARYTYFDEEYGFVGFDNFDGTQLRLENE